MDLLVLTHARRKLGSQVNQRLLQEHGEMMLQFGDVAGSHWERTRTFPFELLNTANVTLKTKNTYRAWTNPEVLLLHEPNIFINSLVPQHLKTKRDNKTSVTNKPAIDTPMETLKMLSGLLTESTVSCCEKPTEAMP